MPNGQNGYEKTDRRICSRRETRKREGLNEYLCVRKIKKKKREKNVGAYNQKRLKTRGDQAGDKEI